MTREAKRQALSSYIKTVTPKVAMRIDPAASRSTSGSKLS